MEKAITAARRKVVMSRDLPDYGINYSRVHIHRMVKDGKWPAPFKLSANVNAWFEDEILDHLAKRAEIRGVDERSTAKAQRAAKASVASRQKARA